jgi:fumarate reductase subunit D
MPMIEYHLSKPQLWLLFMIAVLVIATIAPVAVLAA